MDELVLRKIVAAVGDSATLAMLSCCCRLLRRLAAEEREERGAPQALAKQLIACIREGAADLGRHATDKQLHPHRRLLPTSVASVGPQGAMRQRCAGSSRRHAGRQISAVSLL